MKNMKKWIVACTAALLLSVVLNSCGDSPKPDDSAIVAEVGDYKITVAELKNRLEQDYKDKAISEITAEEKQQSLDKLIDVRRKAVWAVRQQLEKDPAYQTELEKFSDRTLAMSLYQETIIDEMFPTAMMEKYYDWFFTDVKAVVVKIGFRGAGINEDRSEAEAYELAEKYTSELAISQDAVLAAKTLSEGNKKAVLSNPYTIGRMPMKGDSLIFNTAVGSVGGPVKLSEALVLVKVLEKQTREKDRTFDSVRGELLRIFRGQQRNEEAGKFNALSEQFRRKYNAIAHDAGINELVSTINQWGKSPQPKITDFSDEQRKIIIGEVQGEPIYSGGFLDFASDMLTRDYSVIGNFSSIKERFLMQELNLRSWVLEAKAAGQDKNPKYLEEMERFTLGRLARMIEDKEVNEHVTEVTEAEIETYYRENPDKFTAPARVEVWQIVVNAQPVAQQIYERARNGEDFKALYDEFVGKANVPVTHRYELGMITPTHRMKEIADAAFAAGGNNLVQPVEFNNSYHIIKTGKFEPEKVKDLASVRSSVQAAVLNEKRGKRREQVESEISAAVSAEVHSDVLKAIG